MLSVLEVKRKLPKEFIEKLYENLTPLTVNFIRYVRREKHNSKSEYIKKQYT